ncbi:xylitol dehydrogenase [Datura stramonium]|uniref:Ferredoxin n=1 Tax=Datura stramonium TaxID=4076 RepID=A0ABS8T7G8_DATST|nr:xylitol dehydrogenase [Datura stramonium]
MGTLMKEERIEEESKEAVLYVNGVRRVLPDGLAHFTLLQYLREVGLTGTKLGCGEGGCGACTVMVSYFDQNLKKCVHHAINACLAPLYSVEGMHVITVEGIGNRKAELHPIQESLTHLHGSQCGFCTPGFVMSMYALLRSSKEPPTEEQIEESLAGNLCRCTGYRPIADAFRVFAKTNNALYTNTSLQGTSTGEFICPSTGEPCSCGPKAGSSEETIEKNLSNSCGWKPFSYSEIDGTTYTSKEFIFPPELLLRKLPYLCLSGSNGLKWYRPLKLLHLLDLKARFPEARLVVGNSEVGTEVRLKRVLISVAHVPELNHIRVEDDGLEIGAAVKLSQLVDVLKKVRHERPEYETSSCRALIDQIKWFGGTQLRNVASVGGNICTASPISDLNPLWIAAGAKFHIIDCSGNVRTCLAKNFFQGNYEVDLRSSEILLSVSLPWNKPFEFVKEYKQSHRRDDDFAIVNAGMRVCLEEKHHKWVVSDALIVYGGVAPLSFAASKTSDFLVGKNWNKELLHGALKILGEEIVLKEDAPGGMVEFRKSLTLSFFFKFFLWVCHQMDGQPSFIEKVPASHISAVNSSVRPSISSIQDFEIRKNGTSVGSPETHMSSRLQVSGEAEYTDDVPTPPNCLHAALVACCLVIGIVVADTRENAKLAAGKVQVEYEELPAVLSIEDAIQANSYHTNAERRLAKGDVEQCFQSGQCDHIIEGEVSVGGQEHFYLEPQGTLIWTVDSGNEVHMISSTQSPQKHQEYVSHVLGLPMSKVVCTTKRIGGGFGGKESRSAFLAAAVAVPSYLLDRPVKLVLDRDIDMMITGQRHSFLGKYKVGFTNDGKVLAFDLRMYNNGGNSLDLSLTVLEGAMLHANNAYEIPNIRVYGNVCFTNFPSNTAFRGFGAPQVMLMTENWIERIGILVNKIPEEIREMNFVRKGSILYYGQKIEDCNLGRLWNELKSSCGFINAQKEVENFNRHNRWKKRGIAMVPTNLGISFTTKFVNQAGALVQVYTDGTVLVTHGGVEMGQGLHTKIAQIAATSFNIPLNAVFISETSTDKVPNASATAASVSSDLYGAAVLDACKQIKARIEPIASKNNFSSFAELVNACYLERIDLSAHGFYVTPDIGFDWESGNGNPFRYFTSGAAFSEVEIDTLTGDFHTRRADILVDVGFSLNPAIDVGQIEGGFIQGLGWVALEELKWGGKAHKWIPPGFLFTRGPGTYKLPSLNDVPSKFNVSLLKNAPNTKAIYYSKAVGEPPFFLASAVFFAIKNAIKSARAEAGYSDWFPLDNPATPERIRMACTDEFTKLLVDSDFRPKLSV